MGRRNIKREMGNDLGPRWAPPAAAAADRSRHARRFPPVVRPVLGPRGPRTGLRHQEGSGIRAAFVTRSLRLVRSRADEKCIVCRVDHDWGVTAQPR